MLSPSTLTIRCDQHINTLLRATAGLALASLLAACNTTGRGSPESAPPPMKPIETGSMDKSAPAPVAVPAPTPAPPPRTSIPAPSASAPAPAVTPKATDPEPELKAIVVSAGLHRCELGKRVLVKRVASDGSGVQVNWNGKDVNLHSVPTQSGAKRFEDTKAGLAWVVISAKAFILDTKRGQMLANDCKL
jgi:hypothetical protein